MQGSDMEKVCSWDAAGARVVGCELCDKLQNLVYRDMEFVGEETAMKKPHVYVAMCPCSGTRARPNSETQYVRKQGAALGLAVAVA